MSIVLIHQKYIVQYADGLRRMYSGILRRRTDVCFVILLPIFEDVMESATY